MNKMTLTQKLICFVAFGALLLALVSCSGSDSAETSVTTTQTLVSTTQTPVSTTPLEGNDPMVAFEYVSNKMNALGGFEADLVEEQNFGYGSTLQKASVKINLLDGEKGVISMQVADENTGSSYEMDMTYIDGTVYCLMKTQGVNLKYKTKEASVVQSFVEMFEKLKEGDDKDDFANVSFTKNQDGGFLFEVLLTEKAALEILVGQFDELGYDATAFSNITYTMEFVCNSDGYVINSKETILFAMKGMACSVLSECSYKNIGSVPEITVPADADSYADADTME